MSETPTRPILRYHGGKWLLAKWIIGYFPEHRIYVEPFGGAASVLLRKPPSYAEIYNDLDGEIVNVFRMVRERGPELIELLKLTPFAREECDLACVSTALDQASDYPFDPERGMSLNAGMMSSAKADWETPQWLFDRLHKIFQFDFDAAANLVNHKCDRWLGALDYGWLDSLAMDWTSLLPGGCWAKRIFLNPPYGSGMGRWSEKCLRESRKGATVVALLPARTDTAWFQPCWEARHLLFVRGRFKFSNSDNSAPFPSVIAVFSDRDWPIEQLADLGQIINPHTKRAA